MSISHEVFYDTVGRSVFGGALSNVAVDNMEIILDYWFAKHAKRPLDQLAYILATVRREVGSNMAPVRETFAESDDQARTRLAGKVYAQAAGEHGHSYYGRGYVQLTWLRNYERQQKKLGIPIVENPDLALKAEHAINILVEGMLEGDFNEQGHGLGYYVNETRQDFFEARRTVNRLDHAEEIAGNARAFLEALILAKSAAS
jgi:hypothetical protein